MELRELHAFVAVVEEGGMSAASRRLHLSQSTLSHTINALERELGLTLLVRTRTGVQATEAGTALLNEARGLLARHDQALQTMAGFKADGSGVIRLGIPAEMPPDLAPSALVVFREKCPDVRVIPVHLTTSAQLSAVRGGSIDVGLVTERPIGSQLDSVLVAHEPIGVLLSTAVGAGLVSGAGVSLDALAGLTWVGFTRSASPVWHDEIAAVLRGHGLDVGADPPDGHGLTPMVKFAGVVAGQAFALAAEQGGPPLPEGVAWYPLIGEPLVRRIWVVWSGNSRRRDIGELVAAIEAGGRE